MAYKIPKNLSKYSESFLWGLSFKQFGYLSLCAITIVFIFLKLEFALIFKILLALPILVMGMLLTFGKIDEKWLKERNFRHSLKNTGYYDPKIDSFVSIKEVYDDIVFLKSGKMLAILKVQPINFSILAEHQQEYVLNIYRNWLRSLDYEVQVCCRSINLEMNNWFNNLENKKTVKLNKERFLSLKKWMISFTQEKKVRNRVFYIVIPLNTVIKTKKSFSLKNLLIKSSGTIDKNHSSYKQGVRQLNDRVNNCIDALSPCGIVINRIYTNELLRMYSSYFTNMPGGGESYLTPVMWPG